MDFIQSLGTAVFGALLILLALLIGFLIYRLIKQYILMLRQRPRDRTVRNEANIRMQMLNEGYSAREIDDAIRASRSQR